ncbi:unnamed protein product [Citrullus colocynthis]|uniref:Uncharacterized protein n=1 Tax=Citrullus colocynthis TaxID=252529 RepID=A0ABP0Y1R0_9ROSI
MGDMGIGTIRLEFLLGFRFVCLGSFGERLNERQSLSDQQIPHLLPCLLFEEAPLEFDRYLSQPQILRSLIENSMTRRRNLIVAIGLIAFASAGLAFPFYMASSKKPVIDPAKPLPPQATFRGPYINTGSRDVGPDHQTYTKK